MNKTKIAYWTSTVIFGAMMLFSAINYFTNPEIAQAFEHLGFPNYFRIELGIAKIIGVVLLLLPLRGRINEWVYAGFTITLLSAFIAHTGSGDPISVGISPLIFLGVLAVSYITHHKLQ